jgi:hypothetical protein
MYGDESCISAAVSSRPFEKRLASHWGDDLVLRWVFY